MCCLCWKTSSYWNSWQAEDPTGLDECSMNMWLVGMCKPARTLHQSHSASRTPSQCIRVTRTVYSFPTEMFLGCGEPYQRGESIAESSFAKDPYGTALDLRPPPRFLPPPLFAICSCCPQWFVLLESRSRFICHSIYQSHLGFGW